MAKRVGKQSRKKSAARMALRATEQIALPRNGRKAVREDLPADVRAFPDSALLDPATLEKDLGQLFGTLGDLRERNAFGNSVKLLALELGKRLDAGKLSYGDIERLIQQLTAESYAHRAERLAAYLGERDEAKNEAAIRAAVRRVAVPDEAKGKKPTPRPFAEFQGLLERELFGIVMTAHPTFSQSTEMLHNLAELAMERDSAGNKLNAKERARRLTAARPVEQRPPAQIDLASGHKLTTEAITNMQRALARATG